MNLENPFEHREPTPEQIEQMERLRDSFSATWKEILTIPSCREASLAITKLEEAAMWSYTAVLRTAWD